MCSIAADSKSNFLNKISAFYPRLVSTHLFRIFEVATAAPHMITFHKKSMPKNRHTFSQSKLCSILLSLTLNAAGCNTLNVVLLHLKEEYGNRYSYKHRA